MKIVIAIVAMAFTFACQSSTANSFVAGIKDVSVNDAQAAVSKGGVQFIDVRTPEEFTAGHARSAVNIPLDVLSEKLSTLSKDKPIYVICQTGNRSKKASIVLENNGFTNIFNIKGGTGAWIAAGLETEK